MHLRPLLCLAVCLLLAPAPAAALDPARAIGEYGFRTWGSRDGLPNNRVLSIVQTRDGYLWLATPSSILRFDGTRFVSLYSGPPPLALLAGRSGELWYAPHGKGLVRREGSRISSWTLSDGLPSLLVQKLFQDRAGVLWAGTSEGLAFLRGGRFEAVPELAHRIVQAFAEGGDGTLWIGTATGIFRRRGGAFEAVPGAPDDRIWALAVDRHGDLWAGTPRGLGRLRGDRWETFSARDGLPHDEVNALLADRDGNLWIGTEGGLVRFRDGRFASLPGEAIVALCEDAEGALWIAMATRRLARLRDPTFTAFAPPGSPGIVWSAFEDPDGTLWLGTDGHGLVRWRDGRATALTMADGLPADRVRPILRDRRGDLWIGTLRGLARLRGGRIATWTERDGLPNDFILALFEDRDGTLWIGTYAGLARVRDGVLEALPRESGLPAETVYMLHRDRQGRLLVGTRAGLFREEGKGRFQRVAGSPETNIFCVLEDADGTLWLGTARAGLQRLRQGRWTAFRQSDGFPDDSAFQLLEDGQGRFWMSSDRGIYRVRRADLEAFAARRLSRLPVALFGEEAGMAAAECSGGNQPGALVARDGRFWFPTTRGFAIVDPRRVRGNPRPPPVVIQDVLSQGLAVPWQPGAPLELPRGQRNLGFRFAALSLLEPEKVRLLYRLEGFDRDWTEAGPVRSAAYTNLPAGTYVFRVIASNNEGVWNEDGARLDLVIPPFVWETSWFFPLCAVTLLAAGVGSVRLRGRAARRKQRELAHLVEERTRDLEREKARAEEASRAKSEFLANMSHEIRTPMNAVLGMTSVLLGTRLSSDQRDYVETIRQSGEALLTVINDILDVSKIEAGVLEMETVPFVLRDCVEEAVGIVTSKAAGKGIVLGWQIGEGVPAAVESDAARLRQVLVNLLDNAVKFTAAGEVRLDVEALPETGEAAGFENAVELRFAIRDTGIGIPPDRMDRLFRPFSQADSSTTRVYGGTGLGLVISRRLVERLGGTVEVESEPGRGSTFSFTIRCRPAQLPALPARAAGDELAEPPLAGRLPLRVLLAEDNSTNQKVALLMLVRAGYRADVAANGFEVLEALRRQHYDLVLMDVQMPGMDGLEATHRIRTELPPERQPHIIAMTANAMREHREACRAAGMDDFLPKPVLFEELCAALRRSEGDGMPGEGAAEEGLASPAQELSVLDPARLASLRRLGELTGRPIAREIVEGFLTETPRRLEQLRKALRRGDAEEVAFVAHSLKGSSGQLGASRMAALSGELEGRGKQDELHDAPGLLAEIEQEAVRVAHLLESQE